MRVRDLGSVANSSQFQKRSARRQNHAASPSNIWNGVAPLAGICRLRIMCAPSIPAIVAAVEWKALKPIVGPVILLKNISHVLDLPDPNSAPAAGKFQDHVHSLKSGEVGATPVDDDPRHLMHRKADPSAVCRRLYPDPAADQRVEEQDDGPEKRDPRGLPRQSLRPPRPRFRRRSALAAAVRRAKRGPGPL